MRVNVNRVRVRALVRGAGATMDFAPANRPVEIVDPAEAMANGFATARERFYSATRRAEGRILKPLAGVRKKSLIEDNVG